MRFNPNPTQATAGYLVLPKDFYTFEVDSLVPVLYDKDPNAVRHGIQVRLIVKTDGVFKGKAVSVFLGQHDEMNQSITKRFQMAATGANPANSSEEEKWNEEFGPKDWSYSIEGSNKSVGDAWAGLKGAIICADCDVRADKNDASKQYQSFNWKPYLP